MKECVKCKQSKSLTDFYKASYKWEKDGYDYYCKYCRNGQSIKSHRGGNKKPCTVSECEKSHYALGYCRMHYARFQRTGTPRGKHSELPSLKREYWLRFKYLMTLEDFNNRAINGCEICGDKPQKTLHVDHDHKCCNTERTCGKCVRGVICHKCNKAVDKYERNLMRADYPDMEKIKEYVNGYKRSS